MPGISPPKLQNNSGLFGILLIYIKLPHKKRPADLASLLESSC